MHGRPRVSLNAVRFFTLVARHCSIAAAAAELGVTPSAVSHQVRKLERDIGCALFSRRSNAITLTSEGRSFQEVAQQAIAMIERSAASLARDANELVVRASLSLAVRWLIPALERFKALRPRARIRVETTRAADSLLEWPVDVAITYHRDADGNSAGQVLIADDSRPVLAPGLLAASGYRAGGDVTRIPILQCAEANWDWTHWGLATGVATQHLHVAHVFDTDDAAIHAAVAGLGMVLAPAVLTAAEMRMGTLVELPGFVPTVLGSYRVTVRPDERKLVRDFCKWLGQEAGRQVA